MKTYKIVSPERGAEILTRSSLKELISDYYDYYSKFKIYEIEGDEKRLAAEVDEIGNIIIYTK